MNLTETIQVWLQKEINACVQGHDARISRLENTAPQDIVHLASELKRRGQETAELKQMLETQSKRHDAQIGGITEMLEEVRLKNALLEGTLRVMKKQIDALQKTSTDQFHEYLKVEFNGYLRQYAKECGLEDLMDANEVWLMVKPYIKDHIEEYTSDAQFQKDVRFALRNLV
jgi:predicted nuclease with TOPRIM domain